MPIFEEILMEHYAVQSVVSIQLEVAKLVLEQNIATFELAAGKT